MQTSNQLTGLFAWPDGVELVVVLDEFVVVVLEFVVDDDDVVVKPVGGGGIPKLPSRPGAV